MIDAIVAPPILGRDEFPDNAGEMPLVAVWTGHRPGHRLAEQRRRRDRLLFRHHVEPEAKRLRQTLGAVELLQDQGIRAEGRCERKPIIHLSPDATQEWARWARGR